MAEYAIRFIENRLVGISFVLTFGNGAAATLDVKITSGSEKRSFFRVILDEAPAIAYVNQSGAISISFCAGCAARSSSNVISFCGTDLSACEASRQRSQPDVSLSFST